MSKLEQRLHEEFAKEPLNLQAITHILKLNTLYKNYGVYVQAIDIEKYFTKYPHNKARLKNAFIESLINLKKNEESLLPEIFRHLGSSFFMENREFAKSTRDKLDELHEAICWEGVELSRLSLECLSHLMGPESFHQWTSRVAHKGNYLTLAKIPTFDRHPHLNLNSDNLDGTINSWVTYTELQEINELNPFENLVAAIITSKKTDKDKIEEFLRAKTLYKNIYGEELNKLHLNKLMNKPSLKKALLNLLFESLREKYNFPQYKNSIGSFWNHFDLNSISPSDKALTADEFREAVGPHWDSWERTRLFITYSHRLAEFLSEEERVNLFFNADDEDELYDALDEINGYHLFQGFSEKFKSIVAEKLLSVLLPKLITVYTGYKAQPINHITKLHIIHTLLVQCLRYCADPNQPVTVKGYQTTLFKVVYDLHDMKFLKPLLAGVTHFPEPLRLEITNQAFLMLVHKLHDAYADSTTNKNAMAEIKELLLLYLEHGADPNQSVTVRGYETTLFTLVNDKHDMEFLKELIKQLNSQQPNGFTLEYLLDQRQLLRRNESIRTRVGLENDNHLTQIKLLCDNFPDLLHSPFVCQQTTLREWAKSHKDKNLLAYITSKLGPEKVMTKNGEESAERKEKTTKFTDSDAYSKSFSPYGSEEEPASKTSERTYEKAPLNTDVKQSPSQTTASYAPPSDEYGYVSAYPEKVENEKESAARKTQTIRPTVSSIHNQFGSFIKMLRDAGKPAAYPEQDGDIEMQTISTTQPSSSSSSSTVPAGHPLLAPDSPLNGQLTDEQKMRLLEEEAPAAPQGGLDSQKQETTQRPTPAL